MKRYIQAALRRAEKLTKTDVRYVARSSSWLGLTQITSAAVSLGLTAAFANLLPVETYGMYRYVLSAYAIFSIFGLPGMDTSLTQSASRGFDGALLQGLKLKVKWSLLGSVAAAATAAYTYWQGNTTLAVAFVLTAAFLPIAESSTLYGSFMNGKKLFKQWSGMEVTTQVVTTGSLVATMLLSHSLVAIVLAYFISYSVTRSLWTWVAVRRLAQNAATDPDLPRYSRAVSFFQIAARVITSVDQLVLYSFLGPVQVAIFALAQAIPLRVQSAFRVLGTVAFPKLAQRPLAEIGRTMPRKMVLLGVGILCVVGVYILLAPFVFQAIFPRYLPALGYSQVMILYNLGAIAYPVSSALFAHKRLRENYWLSGVSLGLKVAALVVLVPMIGVWGAVVGTLLATASNVAMAFYFMYRLRREPSSGSQPGDRTSSVPAA